MSAQGRPPSGKEVSEALSLWSTSTRPLSNDRLIGHAFASSTFVIIYTAGPAPFDDWPAVPVLRE